MPASRNPFFIRTAEQAESDAQFLSVFSLSVLELLPDGGQWDRFVPIESPPGSGKSTLLRLFTPTVLNSIVSAREHEDLQGLVRKLTGLGVIDESGVRLLGILVNCREDYSRLADLPVDDREQQHLFRILLHARLALLTIRAALQLSGRAYPRDVGAVRFEPRADATGRRPDARVIEGDDIFERARATEAAVVDSLNSFSPKSPSLREDAVIDDVFQVLNTHRLMVDGRETAQDTLIMFDDAHLLEDSQRTALVSELERHDQSCFGSWMAMRLRALEPAELISEEVTRTGRERVESVRFDRWLPGRIENWLLDVGERRTRRAEIDVPSFEAWLAGSLAAEFDPAQLASVAGEERRRAHEVASQYGDRYRDWLTSTESSVVAMPRIEQAARWAQIQVLMARSIGKPQQEFDFGPLAPPDADSSTLEAARIAVAKRNDIPYYFGPRKVAQLGSSNVDQFLALSATLFDRLLNSGNVGRRGFSALLPSEQNRTLLAQSRTYVRELIVSLPYGKDVYNLTTAIAQLCRDESLKPNVPITPGVTGVSISLSDRDMLIDDARASKPEAVRLLTALASAVAHNVVSLRVTDRKRDEDRAVFYLNRLICPAFDLPLGFGGYKPLKVLQLSDWVLTGKPSFQQRLGMA